MTRNQLRLADAFGKLQWDERRVLVHALIAYIDRMGPSEYPVGIARPMLDELRNFYNNE